MNRASKPRPVAAPRPVAKPTRRRLGRRLALVGLCAILGHSGRAAVRGAPSDPGDLPGPVPVADLVSPCRSEPGLTGKAAWPPVIGLGQTVTVTLRLGLRCPVAGLPLDAVLLMDRSSSMAGGAIEDARRAALAFVAAVDLSRSRIAVASFAQRASIDQALSRDPSRLERAIGDLVAQGDTNISAGLVQAASALARGGAEPGTVKAVILLTDGRDRYGADAVRRQATVLRRSGIQLVTVGLGFDVDRSLLEEIATTPDDAWYAPRSQDLIDIYLRLAGRMQALEARDLVLLDALPADMDFVPGSSRPEAQLTGRQLEWRLPALPRQGITLSYRLRPTALGLRPTNLRAEARYLDADGAAGSHVFEVPEVRVLAEPPSATPTPSASPTRTPTPSRTPTASASPRSSPTARASGSPTASSTPSPRATGTAPTGQATGPSPSPAQAPQLFLPLLLRQACPDPGAPLEVMLVLDASTTMEQTTPGGRRRLDLAAEAIARLASMLEPPRERLGLISFNRGAELRAPLDEDPAALLRSLAQLRTGVGSQIDAGLTLAARSLAASRRPGSRAVVILLTDGEPAGTSREAILTAAEALRAEPVGIYVVGLRGAGSDLDLLHAIAGSPERYLEAGDGSGLEAVYAGIAGQLGCP